MTKPVAGVAVYRLRATQTTYAFHLSVDKTDIAIKRTAISMKMTTKSLLIGAVLSGALLAPASVFAEAAKTAVLVHGALADGSSWNKVIPILRENGLKVIAVQNPLESLEGDVAFTQRALDDAEGPVVLVGHSWAGTVITQAGDDEKVKSLVYVSGLAPSKGESEDDIYADAHGAKGIPTVPGFDNPIVDEQGYIALSEEDIVKYFAPDIPEEEAVLIAAGQGKVQGDNFGQPVSVAAWETKPSWYIISANDQIISPDVMRLQAEKIGAKVTELPTSHVPMLAKPEDVARVILEAAAE